MLIFLTILVLLITNSVIIVRQYQTTKEIATIFNQLSELNKKISACDDSIYGIHKVSIKAVEDGLRTLNVKLIKVESELLKNSEATVEED